MLPRNGQPRVERLTPVPNRPDDEVGDVEYLGPSSWAPVDLTDALAGADLPAPELLARTDRVHFFYPARVHWLQGESESCKSWMALAGAAQVLEAGGRVLWVDYEDDERGVIARLRALGVPVEVIAARFVYVRPDEPLRTPAGLYTHAHHDLAELLDGRFDLAVVDGVTEAMVTEGLSMLDNSDIAKWMRLLPKPLADRTGAAVVCIDHLAKNGDGPSRYAIGGQHKLAGTTGAAYRLDVRRRFRRSDGGTSVEGAVAITVVKDRPGWVRSRAAEGDLVGTMTLTSWPDGGVSIAIEPPDALPAPDLGLCRRILEHLAVYDGTSGRRIEETIEGKATTVRAALQWMAEEGRGWVRIERSGRSHLHWLTSAGREEFDL